MCDNAIAQLFGEVWLKFKFHCSKLHRINVAWTHTPVNDCWINHKSILCKITGIFLQSESISPLFPLMIGCHLISPVVGRDWETGERCGMVWKQSGKDVKMMSSQTYISLMQKSWKSKRSYFLSTAVFLTCQLGTYQSTSFSSKEAPVGPRVYIYIPGTCLSSILVVEPFKTMSFPIKTRVIWVPGMYIHYFDCIYI